ncbi:hypothetical protein FACS189487_06860 [Campylobacterota bacterium]|nr:hypothetical protein FACS189487_06860 [Campylobacterota bacterium]
MNASFVEAISTIYAAQGKTILFDAVALRSAIPAKIKNYYKKELHSLYIAIETDMSKQIDSSEDLARVKLTSADRLQNEFAVTKVVAIETIELLAYILRGDTTLKIVNAPEPQPRFLHRVSATSGKKSTTIFLIVCAALIAFVLCWFFFGLVFTDSDTPPEPQQYEEPKAVFV